MEITSDILKKKDVSYDSENYYKFKELNLFENVRLLSYTKFMKLINTKHYLKTVINFVEQIIKGDTSDVSKSILMAYAISAYDNEFFGSYKTSFDKSLMMSANKLVLELEDLNNNLNINEFREDLDHYYSIYKVWESKDSLNQVDKIYDEIQNELEKKKMALNEENIDNIFLKYMNNLFNLNYK